MSHINDAGGITAVLGILCRAPGAISSLLLNTTQYKQGAQTCTDPEQEKHPRGPRLGTGVTKDKYLTQVVKTL